MDSLPAATPAKILSLDNQVIAKGYVTLSDDENLSLFEPSEVLLPESIPTNRKVKIVTAFSEFLAIDFEQCNAHALGQHFHFRLKVR